MFLEVALPAFDLVGVKDGDDIAFAEALVITQNLDKGIPGAVDVFPCQFFQPTRVAGDLSPPPQVAYFLDGRGDV